MRLLLILVGFILLDLPGAATLFGRNPDSSLNQKEIRKAYMESDFDKVAETLEGFRKNFPGQPSLKDRIFTYKYLGVIYAADSTQTVRAESHFNSLLELAPNIELVDMYAPPKIQSLFDRTKAQFHKNREYARKFDELGTPLPTTSDDGEAGNGKTGPGRSAKSRKWVWWGAAATVVGVGVGYFVWDIYFDQPKDEVYKP